MESRTRIALPAMLAAALILICGCMLIAPRAEQAGPNITPCGTVFTSVVKVYLDTSDPEMEIRYTLDGTEPAADSPLYQGPLSIDRSCKLTACSFKAGAKGPSSSASFTKKMNPVKGKHVILLVIDSMSCKMFDSKLKMPLEGLLKLKKRGCLFKTVYTPLPVELKPCENYPWNPSVPNAVIASGTALLGIPDLHKHLVQHKFDTEKEVTAFTANSSTFFDNPQNPFGHGIADGYKIANDIQRRMEGKPDIMFRDDLVFYDVKKLMEFDSAKFIHAHLQGPGSAGYKDNRSGNSIWDPTSEWYNKMLEADKWVFKLLEFLDKSAFWGETVLIVMGDNGQADTGWAPPYEAGSDCTPMIIAGRGVKEGREFEYAEHADIAPTIAYLLGKDFPDFSQGRVLTEALQGYPDEQPLPRWQKRLNDSQKAHHEVFSRQAGRRLLEKNHELLIMNDEFVTAEKIGSWHRRFPSVAAIAEYNEKLLERLLDKERDARENATEEGK